MDFHSISLITTLLLVFVAALVGGLIARKFRQPMLLGYIGAGMVFGNLLPQLTDRSFLQLIADSGVTLLLFTLGVEFSFQRLRKILSLVTWAVIAQILLCLFVFLLILLALKLPFLPALYIATAGALSSTAVVVKILSEKGELETIPGEVATGWLVVQDLAVIPFMILLPALGALAGGSEPTFTATAGTLLLGLGKAAAALVSIVVLGKWLVPKLLGAVARYGSREIFLITTVGIVFLSAIVSFSFGLSAALGAFIAGLLIAETSQNHAVFAEIRPLRDLFAVVFFVTLGMVLPVSFLVNQWALLLTMLAVVLCIKWGVILGLMRYLGYHRKTAFLVAVALTQMSEFGFILAREGVGQRAITQEHYVFLVALTFLTIFVSVPMLSHGHALYYWFFQTLGRWLPKIFPVNEGLTSKREELPLRDHIVICGFGRVGKYIGRALEMSELPFVVVDYNHTTVETLRAKGMMVLFGDPADKDVLDFAQVDYAKALIIAIPDRHTQEMIIGHAQTLNRRIKIICRTHHEEDQAHLKSLGVQTIVQPEFEAALSIVTRLLPDLGVSAEDIAGRVSRLKIEHGLG